MSTSVLAGIVFGVALAALVMRSASSLVFGIAPHDPISFLLAAVGLLVTGWVASYLPARRISAVDPVEVLQPE
jgi:ABC-type antimicrobial peptide transport system permease subunit